MGQVVGWKSHLLRLWWSRSSLEHYGQADLAVSHQISSGNDIMLLLTGPQCLCPRSLTSCCLSVLRSGFGSWCLRILFPRMLEDYIGCPFSVWALWMKSQNSYWELLVRLMGANLLLSFFIHFMSIWSHTVQDEIFLDFVFIMLCFLMQVSSFCFKCWFSL